MNPQVKRYLDILQNDPANVVALKGLEEIYFMEGNWQELMTLYEGQVLRTEAPDLVKAEYYLKMARLEETKLSRPQKAIELYQEVCRLNPTHPVALDSLWKLLLHEKQYALALQVGEMLEPHLKVKPVEHLKFLQEILTVYLNGLNKPALAFDIAEKILEVAPEDQTSFNLLDWHEYPELSWQELLKKIPKWQAKTKDAQKLERYRFLIGKINAKELKRFEEAIRILTPFAQVPGPMQLEANEILADVFEERSDFQAACDHLLLAANLHAQSEDKLRLLERAGALYLDKVKNADRAEGLWRKVFEISPLHVTAFEFLSTRYRQDRNWRELMEVLAKHTQSSEDEEENFKCFLEMGEIFQSHLHLPEKAIRCFERAAQAKPQAAQALFPLLELYQKKGLPEKADEVARRLEALASNETAEAVFFEDREKAAFCYALSLFERKRRKDEGAAIVGLQKVLGLNPLHEHALQDLEELYRKRGNWGDLLHLLLKRKDALQEPARLFALNREIAGIWEGKLQNPEKAYQHYLEAFAVKESDLANLKDLQRLAESLSYAEDSYRYINQELLLVEGKDPVRAYELHRKAIDYLRTQVSHDPFQEEPLQKHLQGILAHSPGDWQVLQELEGIYQRKENYRDLSGLYRKALQKVATPTLRFTLQCRLGQVEEEKLANMQAAIQAWDAARKLDPSAKEPLWALYRIYFKQGNQADFIVIAEDLERVLEKEASAQWLQVAKDLARVFEEEKQDYLRAANYWEKIFKDSKQRGRELKESLLALDRLTLAAENYSLHAEAIKYRIEFGDETEKPALQKRLGLLYFEKLNDPQKGCECFENVFRDHPADQQAFLQLHEFYRAQEKWSDLARILDVLLDSNQISVKESNPLRLERARILNQHLQQVSEAQRLYVESLRQDPKNAAILQEIIEFAQERGNKMLMIEHYRKLADLQEENQQPEQLKETLDHLLALCRGETRENPQALAERMLQVDPAHELAFAILEEELRRGKQWHELSKVLLKKRFVKKSTREEKSILLALAHLTEVNLQEPERARQYREEIVMGGNLSWDSEDLPWLQEILTHNRSSEEKEKFCRIGAIYAHLLEEYEGPSVHLYELFLDLARTNVDSLQDMKMAKEHYQQAAAIFYATPGMALTQKIRDELFKPFEKILEETSDYQELVALLSKQADSENRLEDKEALQLRIGDLLTRQGLDRSAAIKIYEQMILANPLQEEAFFQLEKHYREQDAFAELIKLYESRAEHHLDLREVARLLIEAGTIWEEKLQDRLEASLCYQKAVELGPVDQIDLRIVDRLEDIYRKQGEWGNLAKLVELKSKRVENEAERLPILMELALLYEDELESENLAFSTYGHILSLRADHKPALQALCRLSVEGKRYPEAAQALRQLANLLKKEGNEASQAEYIRTLERLGEIEQVHLSQPEAAVATFREIVAVDPRHIDALKQLRRLYAALENWAELASVYERILDLVSTEQEQLTLLLHLGEIYLDKIKDVTKSLDTFQEVLSIDPAQRQAHESILRLLRQEKRWQELAQAQEQFLMQTSGEEARKILHEITETYDAILVMPVAAIASYWRLSQEFRDRRALERLLEILLENKRWEELSRAYRLRLEFSLSSDEVQTTKVHLAQVLMKHLSMNEEGASILEEVLREGEGLTESLRESYQQAIIALVTYYEQSENWRLLADLLPLRSEVAQSAQERAVYLTLLGKIREEKEIDSERAWESYRAAVRAGGDKEEARKSVLEALVGLTRVLPNRQAWEELREVYEQLVRFSDDSIPWRMAYGRMLLERFSDETSAQQALRHLEEVIAQRPLELEARHYLNEALYRLQIWSRFLDSAGAEVMLEKDAQKKAMLLEKVAGIWEKQMDKPSESIRALQDSLAAYPENLAVRHHLSELLRQQGQVQPSIQVLLDGLEVEEKPEVMQGLLSQSAKLAAQELKDRDKAREYLRRSLMMNDLNSPHRETSRELFDLAFAEGQTLQDDPALQHLYRAYEERYGQEEDAEFFYRYAITLAPRREYIEKRIELLQKAVTLDPSHAAANRLLGSEHFERSNFLEAIYVWNRFFNPEGIEKTSDHEILQNYALASEKLQRLEYLFPSMKRMLELKKLNADLLISCISLALKEEGEWQKQLTMLLTELFEEDDLCEQLQESTSGILSFVLAKRLQEENAENAEQIRRFRYASEHAKDSALLKAASLCELGEIFLSMNQKHQAVKTFEEVLEEIKRPFDGTFDFLPESYQPKLPDEINLQRKLGELLEGTDNKRSSKYLQAYFSAEPKDVALLEKLSAWYEEWKDYRALNDLLTLALKELPERERKTWRVAALRRLAAVRLKGLHDAKGAREIFERIVAEEPEEEEAHMALAALYDEDQEAPMQAIREHEWLLEKDPLRIESYRAILGHAKDQGQWNRASLVAQILELLGEANEKEKTLAREKLKEKPALRSGTISLEARGRYLVHPMQKEYLRELFTLLEGGLEKVYSFHLEKYNLSKNDRVGKDSPPEVAAIWKRANAILRAFGGNEFRLYWDRIGQNRFTLENDKIPALIVSSDFFPVLSEDEQNFLFGRAAQYVIDGYVVVQKVKAKKLEKMLVALLKIIDPETTVTVAQEDIEDTAKTASKIGRRVKKEIRPLLQRHANPEKRIELSTWLKAVTATANRGGLLAAGSLKTVVDLLTKEAGLKPQEGPEVIRKQLKEDKPLRDLITYAASTNYFTLRHLLYAE